MQFHVCFVFDGVPDMSLYMQPSLTNGRRMDKCRKVSVAYFCMLYNV